MGLELGSFLYSILSSVVPIFNIEIYLAAIATQIQTRDAVLLAVLVGFGQAAGKLVWYWMIVHSMRLPWIQRRLEKPERQAQLERWERRIAGRPVVAGGVTFTAGLVGFPPLLVLGVAAPVVRMNVPIFFSMMWLGRGLQSWAILAGLATFLP